jgi:hypothetical protein
MPQDFSKIFQKYERLGGFTEPFSGLVSLSSCLDIHEALSLGSMVEYCRRATNHDRYDLMFVIALAAYKQIDMDVIMFWLAFAFFDKLKTIEAPPWESYFQFRIHQHPHVSGMAQLLTGVTKSKVTDTTYCSQLSKTPVTDFDNHDPTTTDVEGFAQHLVSQFPCQLPKSDPYTQVAEVPTATAMAVIEPEFMRLFQNLQLSEFLDKVQAIVQECQGQLTLCRPNTLRQRKNGTITWSPSRLAIVTIQSLFMAASGRRHAATPETPASNATELVNPYVSKITDHVPETHPESPESRELRMIFKRLVKSESRMMQQYIGDLMRSLDAFRIVQQREQRGRTSAISALGTVSSHIAVQSGVEKSLHCLRKALAANHGRVFAWLKHGALAPCMSPTSLLEQLRSNTGAAQTHTLKKMLVDYGVAISRHQRLLRITDAQLKNKTRIVSEESKNHGHDNWSPMKHPDWLLIELDANLLIRKAQIIVALATISPSSGQNSLLQMNMGQVRFRCPVSA